MAEVKESIEVNVPVSTAYNQWTQFEEFPQFMDNVESVKQIDDGHLAWTAEVGGKQEQWQAEITAQEPDSHIAWRATEGKENAGDIRFESLGPDRTRVEVVMTWEPEGILEATAGKLGRDSSAVKADLERFKELIEKRGTETGSFRGEVVEGQRVD
ncbi:MAG: SRPBCC family protein [Actinobacteria bacterium]|nr:SRPBCC family protein [Actinomycetota bacterium]